MPGSALALRCGCFTYPSGRIRLPGRDDCLVPLVIIRATFLKGVGLAVLWSQFLALFAIGMALMSLAILHFRKSLD